MDNKKFCDPLVTAKGEPRAFVDLVALKTLWLFIGSRCNLQCRNCYVESGPSNDRLMDLTLDDVTPCIDEIKESSFPTHRIGITGGEPFCNPNIIEIIEYVLQSGFEVLILTNALAPMNKYKKDLISLQKCYESKLQFRISFDHYSKEVHDQERGEGNFAKTLANYGWMQENDFCTSIATRSIRKETIGDILDGFRNLFIGNGIFAQVDESNLVVFPEMIRDENLSEISVNCWEILNIMPQDQMCASERMVIKRKGEENISILPCTLLVYDKQFEMGQTLKTSQNRVYLNHQFCAKFCVLGGASCSAT